MNLVREDQDAKLFTKAYFVKFNCIDLEDGLTDSN